MEGKGHGLVEKLRHIKEASMPIDPGTSKSRISNASNMGPGCGELTLGSVYARDI